MIHISHALSEIAQDPALPQAQRQALTALALKLTRLDARVADRTLKRWRTLPGVLGSALEALAARASDLKAEAEVDARWATPPDFWEPPFPLHP